MSDDDSWLDEMQGELRFMTWREFQRHVAAVRKNMKVWEGMKKGAFCVRIEHNSGVVVERRCGASKDECRREAFRELLRGLRDHG